MIENLRSKAKDFNKTSFLHPISKESIYVVPDACHMLKLARNTFSNCIIIILLTTKIDLFEIFSKVYRVARERKCLSWYKNQ